MAIADDAIGITVGVGYIEPCTDIDDDEIIAIKANYEGYVTDELEVFGELLFLMPTDSDVDGAIVIELEGRYDFNANMRGFLNLWVDLPMDSDLETNIWLTPGFQYKQEAGFGDIYYRADLPLYLSGDFDAMDFVGLDFTFSFLRLRDKRFMPDTYGLELGIKNWVAVPDEWWNDDFLQRLTITPYYEHEWFYGEVEIAMPLYDDGMDFEGLTITPLFDINILPVPGLALEVAFPLSNIGADNDEDTLVGFFIGVKYSF